MMCRRTLPVGLLASMLLLVLAAPVPAAGNSSFSPPVRLGFSAGNQWEPAIAADRAGHVYVLYMQKAGVPGCSGCHDPTLVFQASGDHGVTWSAPRILYPQGDTTGQWDPQIVVDPVDGRTVYASWLQNGKSDTVVARSTDLGATWSTVVADSTNAGTDKPILALRGSDVYVAFTHAQKVWVSSSHDRGTTFTAVNVNKSGGQLGWALAGGGTVDPSGNVYFAWAGYAQNGGAKGAVNLFVSKSSDGGATWSNTLIDISGAPPDCSAYACGWAYLGPQMTMASDAAGTVYLLWNAAATDKAPERIFFASSKTAGRSWSGKQDSSQAQAGVSHAFPALAAAGAGDVRIAWMDARASGLWNTYYRRSTDSGAHWSAESVLSAYTPGYTYIMPNGFRFPFGDYFEMDVDDRGNTQVVWGEGLNYNGPGSIWITHGQ